MSQSWRTDFLNQQLWKVNQISSHVNLKVTALNAAKGMTNCCELQLKVNPVPNVKSGKNLKVEL